MMTRTITASFACALLVAASASGQTTCPVSNTPIDVLGSGSYLGVQGGLYGGGNNTLPTGHLLSGNTP